MALRSGLHGKTSAQKIGGRGLNVAHPDVSHLFGIELDRLSLLALLALLVELGLIRRKIRRFFFLLFVLVFCFRDQRFNERKILLCFEPWMTPRALAGRRAQRQDIYSCA